MYSRQVRKGYHTLKCFLAWTNPVYRSTRQVLPEDFVSESMCLCVGWVCIELEVFGCGLEIRTSGSGVYAESQQFVRVQGVQCTQVRQSQEELGKEGAVIRAAAGDERPQSTNQTLLELFDCSHIRYACPVCETYRDNELISQGKTGDCKSCLSVLLSVLPIKRSYACT